MEVEWLFLVSLTVKRLTELLCDSGWMGIYNLSRWKSDYYYELVWVVLVVVDLGKCIIYLGGDFEEDKWVLKLSLLLLFLIYYPNKFLIHFLSIGFLFG